ncbi:TPA: hypothetical protein N0F65_012240 [Lagenidium giganteum]|uniref:TATA-box-binding protein n=1 Tax=Lagenidium giganteum TaxID=4803 RepID=A0AAV2ZD45_9STRA|nr:TPA: hypothetical protein N0F65_012240 [Lagenidium giganteum]
MASERAPELQIKCVTLCVNYVCSANLGMRFDLASLLTKSQKRGELVPKKNCILMKIASPKATAMLFSNGKLVCTGADNEDTIKTAARRFTQIIQKMDYPGVNLIDFKIQNVVGTCDVGFRVLIEELSFAHSDCTTYEPELYPALIYRLEKPKVKILVFVSGKVVFTGSKDPRELQAACEQIYPVRIVADGTIGRSGGVWANEDNAQILRQFRDSKLIEATADGKDGAARSTAADEEDDEGPTMEDDKMDD